MFATHGLPEMLVTDNASYFTSQEFQDFAKLNGIRHVTSAPYHPASNGLAERAVQTVTKLLHWRRGENLQMATHGSISEFVPGREDWVSYMEWLEQYFTANGIEQEEGDKR